MSFAEIMTQLPFSPRTDHGTGFFPPIFRASGHILFLASCIADEQVTVSTEEAREELQHALDHWGSRTDTPNISTAASERASTINTAIAEAITEYEEWTDEERLDNIRNLANRIADFSAFLDRELVGLTGSDAGHSL